MEQPPLASFWIMIALMVIVCILGYLALKSIIKSLRK